MNHPYYFDFSAAVVLKERLRDVDVGNVTTVDSQAKASVSSRDGGDMVLLDFALPKGETGYSTTAVTEEIAVPADPASWATNAKATRVTITDGDGEKAFTAAPGGFYAHPMRVQTLVSSNLSLKANEYYKFFAMGPTNGYLKVSLLHENLYNSLIPMYYFLDTWRLTLFTSSAGKNDYVGVLHLPREVRVPDDWTGQESSLSSDYMEYYLEENTTYALTIEWEGDINKKYLSCKTWKG